MAQKDTVTRKSHTIFYVSLLTRLEPFLAIGRTLIPRYFRSIFDGGVSELYFHLKLAKESFHNPTITLDCDQCTMVTHHTVKPMFTKVSNCSFKNEIYEDKTDFESF